MERKDLSKTMKSASKTNDYYQKPAVNKIEENMEFGGVLGTAFNIVALPALVLFLNLMCNEHSCKFGQFPIFYSGWAYFFDWDAVFMFFSWLFFQAFLALLPVGKIHYGLPLKDGTRLRYRCNGFICLCLSVSAFMVAIHYELPIEHVYNKLFQIMVTSLIFSYLMSLLLYIRSLNLPSSKLAPSGSTGYIIYDFFMGHELNPKIGNLDLKFFCEMRPGLIGWLIINLCMVIKSFKDNIGPSPAHLLVTIFQGLYVFDALWFEDAILTTMDITHDGFGFMLCFGDLVWVPFLYTLQGKYLMNYVHDTPWLILIGISIVNCIGYLIFRLSNSQKNQFRQDPKHPSVAHLESIPTPSKNRLLVSGWWGMCRKPNYLGDIIMSVCWSLTCGFGSIIPYFYPIYFIILLVHREKRDSKHCQKKYGPSWQKYCEKVKYKIFPYIY